MYITELDYHCDLLTSPIVEVDTDIDLSMLLFTMDGLAQVLEKHEEFPANLFYHDTHIVAWYAGDLTLTTICIRALLSRIHAIPKTGGLRQRATISRLI